MRKEGGRDGGGRLEGGRMKRKFRVLSSDHWLLLAKNPVEPKSKIQILPQMGQFSDSVLLRAD
jgi:hypothetical protein